MNQIRRRLSTGAGKYLNKTTTFQKLQHFFPILVWLRNYKLADLRYDIVAGITVGMTLVPQSIAYVSMANLRPEAGLYSAFAGQFIYVLMGTSKDASIGPAAIVAMIVGHVCSSVNPLYDRGDPTCATILALFAGIVLFLVGVLQLGFVVNLFSIPVVSGFTTAAGLTIAASQLAPLVGLKKQLFRMPGVFVKQIKHVIDNITHVNIKDLIFGVSALAFLLMMQNLPRLIQAIGKRCRSRDANTGHRLKPSRHFLIFIEIVKFVAACKNIIVFIVGMVVCYLMVQSQGVDKAGITLVGHITPGLPIPSIPRFSIIDDAPPRPTDNTSQVNATQPPPKVLKDAETTLADLTVGFIVVPVMCIMEMFAILKALGRKNGYRVDARQELMSVGLANIVTAFLGGAPVTAAVTRCALNDQCHVRTQIGSIISAVVVMVAVSFLTSAFFYIPRAILAAIITVAALNLVDVIIIPDVWRHCRSDAVMLVFTILVCVFFEISYGVIICLSVNALLLLRAVVYMQVHITRKHPSSTFSFGDAEHQHSIAICKLSHGLKYPSADKFLDKVAALLEKESHLIIDCTFVQSVDYTGVQAFRSLLLSSVQKGLHVVFANLNEEVHKEFEKLGLDHFHYVSSVEDAIGEYNKAVVISEMEAATSAPPSTIGDLSPQRLGNVTVCSTTGLVATAPSTSRHVSDDDVAKRQRDEKTRRRLMRELSIQPHFYGDLPLMVGGNLDYGDSPEDRGDNGDKEGAQHDNEGFSDSDEDTIRPGAPSGAGSQSAKSSRRHTTCEGIPEQQSSAQLESRRASHYPERNIQFLNRVLLRQISHNSSVRRHPVSRLALVENLTRRGGLRDAVAVINDTPATEFIDIGSPDRFSPVLDRVNRGVTNQ